MDDKKSSDSSDYVVGYGRPPKSKRFVAGKSGNPKGRPKGSRLVGAILRDIIEQKIAVTENGKTRRMPVLEVTFRRLAHSRLVTAGTRPHRSGGDPVWKMGPSYSPATPLLGGEGWCVRRRQRHLDASAQAHRRRIAQLRV
jgi:hypothetical protein